MKSGLHQNLKDLPHCLTGPSAWLGKDMARNTQAWLYRLTTEDIADLEKAANSFLSLGIDVGEITKETFPLTTFLPHIDSLSKTLLKGVGVEVLRGLNISNYSQKFTATIFCGLGSHIGRARSQNADGHILGHVRDVGADANDPNSRIYQTCDRQT
ncbi:MAG: hypothetical protein ACKVJI_12220, partial [Pseudomonadales bacterium]